MSHEKVRTRMDSVQGVENKQEKPHLHLPHFGPLRRRLPDGQLHDHHHFFWVSPHCPFHGSLLQPRNHFPTCPAFARNSESFSSIPPQIPFSSHCPGPTLSYSDPQMIREIDVEPEAKEEEEPVFVLTNEWAEFFAKSEARRREAKKQLKKRGKSSTQKSAT